jgi:hypothetical protein
VGLATSAIESRPMGRVHSVANPSLDSKTFWKVPTKAGREMFYVKWAEGEMVSEMVSEIPELSLLNLTRYSRTSTHV